MTSLEAVEGASVAGTVVDTVVAIVAAVAYLAEVAIVVAEGSC